MLTKRQQIIEYFVGWKKEDIKYEVGYRSLRRARRTP